MSASFQKLPGSLLVLFALVFGALGVTPVQAGAFDVSKTVPVTYPVVRERNVSAAFDRPLAVEGSGTGSISGITYAADGSTPRPRIAISFQDDNHLYGGIICSDENGAYTLDGVPFDVPVHVRADAYRDAWCDSGGEYLSEYWGESLNDGPAALTVTASDPAQTGIDFSIDPVDSTPVPYLAAWPNADVIEAIDWPVGTHLKLKIEDPTTLLSPDYAAEMDVSTWATFDLVDQFQLKPGMIVTASGAYTTKSITVNNITITSVDQDTETIRGTTVPGYWLWMWFDDPACCRSTEADENGDWMMDYRVPGPQDQPTADLHNGSYGAVHVPSGDGRSSAAWALPDPNLDAWYLDGIIEAYGWPMGTHLTLKIDNPVTPSSTDYSAETDVTQTVSWDPGTPLAVFDLNGVFQLEPGMIVTVSGEHMIRKVTIDNLTITSIDQTADTISGTTGHDNWLWMFFEPSCTPTCRSTTANGSGLWSIDYSVPGPEGQPVADIGPASSGGAHVPSGDGRTSVRWSILPQVSAITRASANPTGAASVNFMVVFTEPVTGVDAGDFVLHTANVTGASIANVTGADTIYTVTVNTGTVGSINGTLRLDLVDNDSIRDADESPLGGPGADNGSFTAGDAYTLAAHVTVPTLLRPSRNYTTNQAALTFEWSTVTDAGRYEIQFATDSTFAQNTDSQFVIDPAFSGSLSEGRHYWRVRAYNAANEYGAWSVSRSFTIDTTGPAAPVLRAPANNISLRNVPMFHWTAERDAVIYQFELDDDLDFSSPLVSAEQRIAHRKPAGILRGTYYWRVRARDVSGNWGDWSQPFSVTILRPR